MGSRSSNKAAAVPSHGIPQWSMVVASSYLLATALISCTIAGSPLLLRSVAIPLPLRATAMGLAVVALVYAVAVCRVALERTVMTVSVLNAAIMGCGLTPVVASEPCGVAALWVALLSVSCLVSGRMAGAAAGGLMAGAALAVLLVPPLPTTLETSLDVERTYAGVSMAPLWLSRERALLLGLVAVLTGALGILIQCRRRLWRRAIERYAALRRVLTGLGDLERNQTAMAVAALSDPQWLLVGVASVEWDTVRITSTRAPAGASAWPLLASELRDAAVGLSSIGNPLVRAACDATPVAIRSCGELFNGVWRDLDVARQQWAESTGAVGRAVPFGRTNRRGVVFALGTEFQGSFRWLDDLAGALTVLGEAAR